MDGFHADSENGFCVPAASAPSASLTMTDYGAAGLPVCRCSTTPHHDTAERGIGPAGRDHRPAPASRRRFSCKLRSNSCSTRPGAAAPNCIAYSSQDAGQRPAKPWSRAHTCSGPGLRPTAPVILPAPRPSVNKCRSHGR